MDVVENRNVTIYKTDADYSTLCEKSEELEQVLLIPIRRMIIPGNRVVIKPNFVKESHLARKADWEYIITHTEVIRLVLRVVVEALDGRGEVRIVDAPQTDSDYDEIIRRVKLPELVAEQQAKTPVKISYYDLREERWFYRQGIIVRRKKLPGDPEGYVSINLGDNSEFYGKENKQYYGADYDMEETSQYHNESDNIYVVSKTILDCDVFINLPKMKTHKLAGITGALKNLVGTCVIKNSIPHHTVGSPENGGDRFPKEDRKGESESQLKELAFRLLKMKNPVINYPFILVKRIAGVFLGSPRSETIRNGMWHGNDTIWRSTLDLNKILIYADANGNMHNEPQRKYFALMDGIIAGEGNGPMEPDPKPAGVLIAGENPVCVDMAEAVVMGFDYSRIPTLTKAFCVNKYPLTSFRPEDICAESNHRPWNKKLIEIHNEDTLQFRTHFGWRGIEQTDSDGISK